MSKKTTRRALLSSALALLLCVSMLIGSTFAWFTDEVVSSNNIIKSGTLDVELYYQVEDQTDWTKVDENTNVFMEDALWEPGHTEVVKLKVVNEGTLALKYQLGVNVASETGGVNVDGKEFKLSDYIKFGVIEDAQTYTRDQAVAAVESTATALNKAYSTGTVKLDPKTETNTDNEDIVTLVVYMPTSVGNEANYRGTSVPTINLGINLFATQVEAESDSFDNTYDENAWNNAMKVSTAAELATAIENVEDGGVIVLINNLTFDADSVYDLNGYKEGLYYEGDKSFTIDLNGNAIADDGSVNDYLMLFKNCGEKANTITIKNGTIATAANAYSAICTSGGSTQQITINLEDINVSNTRADGYGDVIRARGGAVVNVKDDAVITGKGVYVTVYAVNATVNIYDGAEIYMNETTSYVGAVVGASNGGTVNAYGGYGKGTQGCFIAMTTGGTINVFGGEWIADCNNTGNDGNYSVLIAQNSTYETYWAAKSIINVTGGTFTGKYNCYGVAAGDSVINITSGTFTTDPSEYVAEGYAVVDNTDGPYTVQLSQESFDAMIAAAQPGETVNVPAGTFTLSGDNNIVIVGSGADTVIDITGTINNIDISNATVTGLNYLNAQTDDSVTFTNVVFDGQFGHVDQSVINGKAKFVGCTFNGGLHIDKSAADSEIVFKNCTFGELCIIKLGGSAHYKFDGCVIEALNTAKVTSPWGRQWVISYGDVTMTDCQIGRVLRAGKQITFTLNNCVDANGEAVTSAIVHSNASPFVVIDGVTYVGSADALATAVAGGATNLYLLPGEYDVYGCANKTLTINGTKDTVIKVMNDGEDGCDYAFGLHGLGNVTFNGVTIDTTSNTGNYKGFAYMKGTFNDCNFVGAYSLNNANDFVFNRCTFDFKNGYFWTWGANSVTFDGCTFNGNSKTILAHGGASTVITINNCTFAATEKGYTGSGDNTAVVEIDPAGSNTYTIKFTGTNTKTDSYAGWTRIKDGSTGHTVTGIN